VASHLLSPGYLLRETAISAAINGVLSALAFYALFGRSVDVPVWGLGGLAFDFVPQSFAVALMGTLVPGLLAAVHLRRTHQIAVSTRRLVARAVITAAIAAALAGGVAAIILRFCRFEPLDFYTALPVKVSYGVLLALIVTSVILRSLNNSARQSGGEPI
jgi:hypothetical protein